MAKDFKGHLEPDDPRDPLWGAGGARWPTIPPYRLRLGVLETSRRWRVLTDTGVMFEAEQSSTYLDVTYLAVGPFPYHVTGMWLWRHFDRTLQNVWWLLFIDHEDHHEALQVNTIFDPGPANIRIDIENTNWPYAPIPDPGGPFELWQVYYNEDDPPEGWPPWA